MSQFAGMSTDFHGRPILVPHDHPVLHAPCVEYDWNDDREKFEHFVSALRTALYLNKGIGISAPQLGVPLRIMCLNFNNREILVNPVLLATSEGSVLMDEGCLSYRGLFIKKKRPSTVRVRYQDELGETHTKVFSGITARVFLHEYDHLEGKTFVDNPSVTTKNKFEKWKKSPWKFDKYRS